MTINASEKSAISSGTEAGFTPSEEPTTELGVKTSRKSSRRSTSSTGTPSNFLPVSFPNKFLPLLLILPEVLVVAVFFIWPSAQAIYQSTIQSNAFGLGSKFAGLANFKAALASGYTRSLTITAIFTLVTTVVSMAIGLLLAMQVEQTGRFRPIYRTLFIWSYAVPGAVAGTIWLFLFEPKIGPGAKLLQSMGIHWNFALSGSQAFTLICAMTIWQQCAYNYIFFSAGLQAIPANVIEAAGLDCKGWQKFKYIIFPLLSPTTLFVLILDVLSALFGSFSVIDIVSQGGPGGSTTTLVYALYRDGFQNGDVGLAGAETLLLFVLSAILLLLQSRITRRRVHYR